MLLSHWAVFVILLVLISGCQSKEPALGQKAAALVIVVQDTVARLTTALAGPVADSTLEEVNFILKDYFAGAGVEPRLPVRYAGVTNNQGIIRAAYPKINSIGSEYSKYSVGKDVSHNCL